MFLQETKLYSKGHVTIPGFFVFEKNCTQNTGGGLIMAVHKKFNPSLVEADYKNPDILSVQCKIGTSSVRLINGYGPQESDPSSDKLEFFTVFESAIKSAHLNGNLICAQLDANSKIGKENMASDPHHISANGQLLTLILPHKYLNQIGPKNET